MNFIERLLDAAKDYPVQRLSISRYEIVTDPKDARDHPQYKGDTGWPAAWAIAKKAGVAWGCGNSGQHQISVSDWRDALPPEYVVAEESASQASAIATTARMIADSTRDSIAQEAARKAVEMWLLTTEAQAMIADAEWKERLASEANTEMYRLRPAWVHGAVWFDVPHGEGG